MRSLLFFVKGEPKAEPRPRCTCFQGRGKMYTKRSDELKEWRKQIAAEVRKECRGEQFEGPLMLDVYFIHPRPQRLKRKKDPDWRIRKDTKPDLDNLLKPIMDVLTEEGVWKDDSQVFHVRTSKHYVDRYTGAKVGAEVLIEEMPYE